MFIDMGHWKGHSVTKLFSNFILILLIFSVLLKNINYIINSNETGDAKLFQIAKREFEWNVLIVFATFKIVISNYCITQIS